MKWTPLTAFLTTWFSGALFGFMVGSWFMLRYLDV